MKKWILYGLWALFYVCCAVAGCVVAQPEGAQSGAMLALSLLFFVPPALLLIDARRHRDRKGLLTLRWVSGISLVLTVVLLVANVASALGSEALGQTLYVLLVLVSVPMVSSQQWFLSMFLWACIFFVTLTKKKK
jgi:hypothetical protein